MGRGDGVSRRRRRLRLHVPRHHAIMQVAFPSLDFIHRSHQIQIGGRRAKSLESRDGDEKWQEIPRPQRVGIGDKRPRERLLPKMRGDPFDRWKRTMMVSSLSVHSPPKNKSPRVSEWPCGNKAFRFYLIIRF